MEVTSSASSPIQPSPEKKRSARSPGRPWTKEEDQKLINAVERFGTENWARIAESVGMGRTRGQCSQRWLRGLDPTISRDRWTSEEEEKLLSLVEVYGTKAWTKIAREMKSRNDVQCRYHHRQMLRGKTCAGNDSLLRTKEDKHHKIASVPIFENHNSVDLLLDSCTSLFAPDTDFVFGDSLFFNVFD